LDLPIGFVKFLFPKEFVTIFGLGYPFQRTPYLLVYCHYFGPPLIALPKNTLTYWSFEQIGSYIDFGGGGDVVGDKTIGKKIHGLVNHNEHHQGRPNPRVKLCQVL
jgi:hypothetical protein